MSRYCRLACDTKQSRLSGWASLVKGAPMKSCIKPFFSIPPGSLARLVVCLRTEARRTGEQQARSVTLWSMPIRKLFIASVLVVGLFGRGSAHGATAFTDMATNLLGLSDGWLAWGDFNNDGRLDLIASGQDPSYAIHTLVYSNAGNGTFVLAPTSLPPVFFTPTLWGDYDNDGRL